MTALPLFVHSDIDDMTDLTPNALRVYMHLARRANKAGVAWPSYQTIGDHCFTSVSENPITRRSMARKAIDELIAAGLIEKENRQNDGGHTSNAYLLAGAMPIDTAMPMDTAMPHNEEPVSIGTKDTLIEDTPEQGDDEEEAQARDPIHAAWFGTYQEEMPPKIEEAMPPLVIECGLPAVIHGVAKAAAAGSRNFRYIAECARNYIPPPPVAQTNGYAVAIADSDEREFNPPIHPIQHMPYSPAPPPLPTDSLWETARKELVKELPYGLVPTLEGSTCEAAGMINRADGSMVPLYRVLIAPLRAANGLNHFTKQAGPSIRKKLGSILGYAVQVEIVAYENEPV